MVPIAQRVNYNCLLLQKHIFTFTRHLFSNKFDKGGKWNIIKPFYILRTPDAKILHPSGAEFVWGNMKIYLHFRLFLNAKMVQEAEIFSRGRQRSSYLTRTISWVLMTYQCKEPCHQQPWYSQNISAPAPFLHDLQSSLNPMLVSGFLSGITSTDFEKCLITFNCNMENTQHMMKWSTISLTFTWVTRFVLSISDQN